MTPATPDWFETTPVEPPEEDVMRVDLDGYEGPLDLLLDMARRQKIDLAAISILALAEQYLAFIETVRERRIEVAADYLVMAAWLAYLKSRLMVPQTSQDEEPSGEMLVAILAFRLKRLEAMRLAANRLMGRSLLGIDVFARGEPETIVTDRKNHWDANLYDLLKAYAVQRERGVSTDYTPIQRTVWSLQEAREVLERLIGQTLDWLPLDSYLVDYLAVPAERATIRASSFSASLELVRQGQLELRQSSTFGPLMVRRRSTERT